MRQLLRPDSLIFKYSIILPSICPLKYATSGNWNAEVGLIEFNVTIQANFVVKPAIKKVEQSGVGCLPLTPAELLGPLRRKGERGRAEDPEYYGRRKRTMDLRKRKELCRMD